MKNIIHRRFEDKYGVTPANTIVKRLENEIKLFERLDLMKPLETLLKIINICKNEKSPYQVRGIGAGSFLFYLLGITFTNPLPSHYYCSTCKKTEFAPSADGFDLPNKS